MKLFDPDEWIDPGETSFDLSDPELISHLFRPTQEKKTEEEINQIEREKEKETISTQEEEMVIKLEIEEEGDQHDTLPYSSTREEFLSQQEQEKY